MQENTHTSQILNLPEFDYQTPASKQDVVGLLFSSGGDAVISAGGMDLIPNMKNGTIKPKTLISLNRLSPEEESITADGALRIDALATLSDIAESPLIKKKVPTLAAAALHVGGQQIRNRATLGGNLCQDTRCLYLNQSHGFQFVDPCYKRGGDCCYPYPGGKKVCRSVFMSDTAPVLMSLGAQLVILDNSGEKVMDINDFYTGDGLKPLQLGPAEMISAILIPPESQKMQCRFVKATPRGGLEFAILSVAIALKIDAPDKKCGHARIVVGSINASPLRAFNAAQELVGHRLDAALAAEVARIAADEVEVLPHHGFSKGYLKQLLEVHIKRSLCNIIKHLQD